MGFFASEVEAHCIRDHPHVRIQGGLTRKSAMYTPELGMHLAVAFWKALRVAEADPDVCCLVGRSRRTSTFLRSVLALPLFRMFSLRAPRSRFVSLLDPSVARGVLAKGRSTSCMLQPLLKRAAVLQVCFDLYPVWPFCLTRLNTAGDPTRHLAVRESAARSILGLEGIDFPGLHRTGLRRFSANWVRLLSW